MRGPWELNCAPKNSYIEALSSNVTIFTYRLMGGCSKEESSANQGQKPQKNQTYRLPDLDLLVFRSMRQ